MMNKLKMVIIEMESDKKQVMIDEYKSKNKSLLTMYVENLNEEDYINQICLEIILINLFDYMDLDGFNSMYTEQILLGKDIKIVIKIVIKDVHIIAQVMVDMFLTLFKGKVNTLHIGNINDEWFSYCIVKYGGIPAYQYIEDKLTLKQKGLLKYISIYENLLLFKYIENVKVIKHKHSLIDTKNIDNDTTLF